MRKNKVIVIIVMLLFLCSCGRGENELEVQVSSQDYTVFDLASKIYSSTQLLEIIADNGSIEELNTRYPIECIRENEDTYRVTYPGDDCVAVIIFDKNGNKLLSNIYNVQNMKADFDQIKEGESLDRVKEIDPNGNYLFLYTGRNDFPRKSTHYTEDGYLITIEYDSSNIVLKKQEELI